MKVLIISDLFYPNNSIGAVRPTKIAKKLLENGHQVDVFTRYRVSESEIKHTKMCSRLVAIEDYNPPSKNAKISTKKKNKVYEKAYRFYLNILSIKKAKKFCDAFKKLSLENEFLKDSDYDAVFSTFGPLSSLFCGMYYKKLFPNVKWICDFRDPVVVRYTTFLAKPFYKYYQRKACKLADSIVAVSYGYLELICGGKYRDKAYMIPNGYDLDDLQFSEKKVNNNDVLNITYVGSLYNGDRDVSVLFKAIKELIDEGKINKEKIKVNYAGKEYSVICRQADTYDLSEIVVDNGLLSREACLKLQFSSDALLLCTWNDKNEYGVFPGKFLEYMLIGKPIISITNGELPNSEVTRVTREGEFGIAYETATHSTDYAQLKSYINKCYEEWSACGTITFSPKTEVLERYDYRTIIKRIEMLING